MLDERVVIEELIGEGGFGLVYRARHTGFDEPVAVKCLKVPGYLDAAQRAAFLDDFRAEARLLHRLSRRSAGIVQALDVGAATSPRGVWTPYIVMEWLEGKTLEQDLATVRGRRAGRPVAEAVELLAPAARALEVAHLGGIAHLDIKPANLFLVEEDGRRSLKVLDFGIARVFTGSRTLSQALPRDGTGSVMFTPAYAAPEQFNRRHGRTGPHTDVFALALVLLELVSGRIALDGDTPLQLYITAANEFIRPSFASSGVDVSAELEAVIRRALEVDPQRRFPDAGAMWDALEAAPEPTAVSSGGVRISVVPASATPLVGAAPTVAAPPSALLQTGQRRVCTVLNAELVVGPGARQLDPETLARYVERCLAAFSRIVEEAGGHVEQDTGEAIVASFGLHADTPSAAERAVDAALRLPGALDALPLPPRLGSARPAVRVGIDTGRVYRRTGVTMSARGPALAGVPVTVASRLQRRAAPNTVLIARDSYREVAGLFELQPVVLELDEGEPLRAYLVRGRARPKSALDALAVRDFLGRPTRLIGRAIELEGIAAVVDEVTRASDARQVVLWGAAGIGKSRILSELALRLEADGVAVLAARASPLARGTSYALAASLLRARFSVHEDDPREIAEEKLLRGVRALRDGRAVTARQALATTAGVAFDDPRDIVQQLLRLLGYAGPKPSGEDITANDKSAPVKHRIAAAFAALAAVARRPIALLCDDVHAADDASLDLFEDLVVRLAGKPALVVFAGHPALLERRSDWAVPSPRRRCIEVGPLAPRQLEEMARDRLGAVVEPVDELCAMLAKRAEGYPTTLVETLHLLVDAGAIDASSEPWRLHADRVGALALPTTVQGIVQARLDRLEPQALDLVCKAAVVGPVFWDGALAELDAGVEADRAPVIAVLADLVQRGLVRVWPATTFPGEQEYVFAESALCEVAYETLPHPERIELHHRVAEWLERRAVGDAGAALLARHYERAARPDDAMRAFARAGAHAASLGQNAEALHCYERACAIDAWLAGESDELGAPALDWGHRGEAPRSGGDWPERVRLHVELGDTLRRLGRLSDSEQRFAVARRCIAKDGDAVAACWEARIDFRLAHVKDVRGKLMAARELVERAIVLGERGGLAEERAQMVAHLAGLCLRDRDTDKALASSLAGLRICRALERRGERWREAVSWLLRTLGGVFYHRGRMVRAERCYLQASRLLDERDHPLQLSRVLNNVAATRFARGDFGAARDAFHRTYELARKSGDLWVTMTALGNLGEVELALGRHESARDCLEEAVRLGEAMGAVADVAEIHRNRALVWLALGDPPRAIHAARRALELARRDARGYLSAVVDTATSVCVEAPASEALWALATELLDAIDEDLDADPELAERCRSALAALA
jgi:class 3 adenylate cyclase/tetratricopeptide (TPR) repeat protein